MSPQVVDTPPDIAVGTAGLGSLEELTKVRLSLLRCVCMCVVCVVVVCVCYVRACVCVCVCVCVSCADRLSFPASSFSKFCRQRCSIRRPGSFFKRPCLLLKPERSLRHAMSPRWQWACHAMRLRCDCCAHHPVVLKSTIVEVLPAVSKGGQVRRCCGGPEAFGGAGDSWHNQTRRPHISRREHHPFLPFAVPPYVLLLAHAPTLDMMSPSSRASTKHASL